MIVQVIYINITNRDSKQNETEQTLIELSLSQLHYALVYSVHVYVSCKKKNLEKVNWSG